VAVCRSFVVAKVIQRNENEAESFLFFSKRVFAHILAGIVRGNGGGMALFGIFHTQGVAIFGFLLYVCTAKTND